MRDTIYRQDAIDCVSEMLNGIFVEHEDIARKAIGKLPSAQPTRKTGKWITVNGRLGNEVECNQCHSVFWYWMGNYSFCPSCGARMEGDNL